MSEKINIVLASDDSYAQHVAVVMTSILRNTRTPQSVKFFLLSDGICAEKINKIQQTVTRFGAEWKLYDLSADERFADLFTSGHISRAAYFRLEIANILTDVQKIIYLDVDLVVLQDIADLWKINLAGKPLAAVPDFGIMASKRMMRQKHEVLGLSMDAPYFNSGVVIMDLAKWREHHYAEQVLELAGKGKLPHHDQDALNKVFLSNWYVLPLKWNVIPPVYNLLRKIVWKKRFRIPAIAARKDIAVLHYAGRYKAWEFVKTPRFNAEYYRYLADTAFAKEKMPQPGKNMKGKSLMRQLLRIKWADFISMLEHQ